MPKLLPNVQNREKVVILLYLQANKLVCFSITDCRHETPGSEKRMFFLTAKAETRALLSFVLVPPPSPFTRSKGVHYRRETLGYRIHHCHSKWKQFLLGDWSG